jgi:hypothetical protein
MITMLIFYIELHWVIFPILHNTPTAPQLRPQFANRCPQNDQRPLASHLHMPKKLNVAPENVFGGAFSPGGGPGDRTRGFPLEKPHINEHTCNYFIFALVSKAIFDYCYG